MASPDYSKMTMDEFDVYLVKVLQEVRGVDMLFQIPGVYDLVSDYYNNDVLDLWAEENPDKAYPQEGA